MNTNKKTNETRNAMSRYFSSKTTNLGGKPRVRGKATQIAKPEQK